MHVTFASKEADQKNAAHMADGVEDLAVTRESANMRIRHVSSRGMKDAPFFHRKIKAETYILEKPPVWRTVDVKPPYPAHSMPSTLGCGK